MPRPLKTRVVFAGEDLVDQTAGLDLDLPDFLEKLSGVHGNSRFNVLQDSSNAIPVRGRKHGDAHGTSILFRTSCTTCSEVTSSASAS